MCVCVGLSIYTFTRIFELSDGLAALLHVLPCSVYLCACIYVYVCLNMATVDVHM
jgi:hypothetical protein